MTDNVDELDRHQVNRRAMLTKAAAAGAIAWTAPVVLSKPVSAADACTPDCAPPLNQAPQVNPMIRRQCGENGVRNYYLSGADFPSVITCPCDQVSSVYALVSPGPDQIIYSATKVENQPIVIHSNVPIVFTIACNRVGGGLVYRTCTRPPSSGNDQSLGQDTDNTCVDGPVSATYNFSAPCGSDTGCA
ncbi:hypothetical protein [Ilumatobacter sp.]|uniref:hypothetical protein n=1 Tax=Ilumatobacter sp. TaxID=1967498 RepID=UPI003C47AD5B